MQSGPISDAAGGILSYFTRHRTVANLVFVAMVVAGLFAFPNIRSQFFPDATFDQVTVTVTWDQASADDVDSAIIQVLEPVLMQVEGVTKSWAVARPDTGTVRLEFEPNWDMSRAATEVQDAVDTVTELPEDVEEPRVRRAARRDRVTDVIIAGPVSPEQLGLYGDEFVKRLFAAGVTRTTFRGYAAPQITVEVPSIKLISNDVTMAEIAEAIAAEVDTDPAGNVAGANTRVRTGTEKRVPEKIAEIVLRSNPDGSKLRVGDIAQVTQEGPDRERAYFVGPHPAISIRVDRADGGDSIGVQRTVERVAAEMRATLQDGMSIELIRTRAEAITSRLNTLLSNGLTGLGLVVCLLFLFLNARTAFWVAAGIPAAMLAAIGLMYAAGLTLNMISLFGLIITLGIVVDDAIVVAEHADHRARHFGEPPFVAAERAARRMALPVFAATITTVIAFMGLFLVGGWFGTIVKDIPFTVIAVLLASLVECFLVLPNHMAHALAAQAKERWYDWPSRQVNRGFVWVRHRLFKPMIAGVITARYAVLSGLILILALQVSYFISGEAQWRFWNAPERSSVTGNFAMAEGAQREDAQAMMLELQRATEALAADYEARYGVNPVLHAIAEVGGTAGRGLSGSEFKDPDLLGSISITLISPDDRPYSSFAFTADLRDLVTQHPLTEVLSFHGQRDGQGGDALSVEFSGQDSDTLKAASLDLQAALLRYPEVLAVEDNLTYDREELILDLTPRGQALGFTIDGLGRVLRHRLGGIEAATFPDGPRSATIEVQLPKDELTADFLDRTQMRTPDGVYVPLSDIVTVQSRIGFRTISRVNGVRVIWVRGDISADDPQRAAEIERALEQDILPSIESEHQVDWRLSGLAEEEDRFLSEALNGLILCLFGIYLVLAWVFGSWTRPLLVMSVVPFGLVGVIYGHMAWDMPLNIFTVVGLLGMTGIIINDSIVLITTIDEYAEERGLIPSIIDGAADRLRPVMLTTMTTVLGMLPMLQETSRQAAFLKPTVITLVYGLGFGMVIVLLLVPALIAIKHDLSRQIKAMRRGLVAPVAVVRAGFTGLWGLIALWGGATLGWTLLQGGLSPVVLGFFPELARWPAMSAALLTFIGGAAVLVLAGYVVAAIVLLLSRKRGAA
ncbi:efflux RND transporter permease subunit [Roseobacter sinensis]|uniref:Efflux RND transporter permease subunit n=1 Tax=Roseobacter sinensis TaxID=2931391 RepID=A0ABT3BAU8_9RHOB|nr:efflux RND transporter permease subunit [Roseobacter sp. WL0113]MCV3270665.1 efflux RND transporter permease subunit [Roseobacter sp. WL0113]